MKNSSTYERKFRNFVARLRKAYRPPAEPAAVPVAPTPELIWAALLEDASEGTAKVALSRLTGHFVDYNELRVSRPEEIAEALPNTLGNARDRAQLIIKALQRIFDRFDKLEMLELRDAPKREARNFVASIPGMTPYVEGRVCLLGLGVHAMPVDRQLVGLLIEQGVVHPETDAADTQGFLERVVPAKDAVNVALLLEAFRQEPAKAGPPPRGKPAARAVPSAGGAIARKSSARKSPAQKK
ncbi:MAG: hypothetical protein BIFFINMI_04240 [Phycisphaerae bacterium]|nr:hypothetical protein [Phycisphaerae bacterium]